MRRDVQWPRDFAEAFLLEAMGRGPVPGGWTLPEAVCRDVQATPLRRPGHPLLVPPEALSIRAR